MIRKASVIVIMVVICLNGHTTSKQRVPQKKCPVVFVVVLCIYSIRCLYSAKQWGMKDTEAVGE